MFAASACAAGRPPRAAPAPPDREACDGPTGAPCNGCGCCCCCCCCCCCRGGRCACAWCCCCCLPWLGACCGCALPLPPCGGAWDAAAAGGAGATAGAPSEKAADPIVFSTDAAAFNMDIVGGDAGGACCVKAATAPPRPALAAATAPAGGGGAPIEAPPLRKRPAGAMLEPNGETPQVEADPTSTCAACGCGGTTPPAPPCAGALSCDG